MKYEELRVMLKESGKGYDMEMIEKAYVLAEKNHAGQFRKTGEPYIEHPLSVAAILAELGMDSTSIVAAILHDVVEDTAVTIEEVEKEFNKEVALLVDGVTKLGQIPLSTQEEQQAENLRIQFFTRQ